RGGMLFLSLLAIVFFGFSAWHVKTILLILRDEGLLVVTGERGTVVITGERAADPITLEPDQREGVRLCVGEYDVRLVDGSAEAIALPGRITVRRGQRSLVEVRKPVTARSPDQALPPERANAAATPALPDEFKNSI